MRDTLINSVGMTGLAMMGVGLWWFSPALSLTITGGLLLTTAVYAARLGQRLGYRRR